MDYHNNTVCGRITILLNSYPGCGRPTTTGYIVDRYFLTERALDVYPSRKYFNIFQKYFVMCEFPCKCSMILASNWREWVWCKKFYWKWKASANNRVEGSDLLNILISFIFQLTANCGIYILVSYWIWRKSYRMQQVPSTVLSIEFHLFQFVQGFAGLVLCFTIINFPSLTIGMADYILLSM